MGKKQMAGMRIKAGEGFAAVESPRGVLGCYVISTGGEKACASAGAILHSAI
jgi:NADH:ubiquinone oxidoreductase subunit D